MGKRKRVNRAKVASGELPRFSLRNDAIACGVCGTWLERRELRRSGQAMLTAGRVLCGRVF
jgi:hypothetical protein